MKKKGHGINEINDRFVGNEQKLVLKIQKFPKMVDVKAKQKVVYAREKIQRKEGCTFRHYLNVFSKSCETTSGSRCDPRVSGSPFLLYDMILIEDFGDILL